MRDRVFFGHDALVRLELAGGQLVLARCLDAAGLAPGAAVRVAVRGKAVCFPP